MGKSKKPLEILSKYKYVLLAAALGAALLLWPTGGGAAEPAEKAETAIKTTTT